MKTKYKIGMVLEYLHEGQSKDESDIRLGTISQVIMTNEGTHYGMHGMHGTQVHEDNVTAAFKKIGNKPRTAINKKTKGKERHEARDVRPVQ